MADVVAGTALEARAVTVGYGGRPIIENLDLDIPEGCFTALIGPNGSGKSTVLRALAGFIPLTKGQVKLRGHCVADMPRKALARQLSLLPQNPAAPEGLTVLDLVRQGRYPHRSILGGWSGEDESAVQEALRSTRMCELAGHPLEALSGGQRQRAWIAMILAQQADVLLLDEPTTFLDIAHQLEVMELLCDLRDRRRVSVVAVIHDINQAARYANHIVALKEGRLLAAGSASETVTGKMLHEVFGVEAEILIEPASGSPYFIPTYVREPYDGR